MKSTPSKNKPKQLFDKIFDNEEAIRQAAKEEIKLALKDFKEKIKKIKTKIEKNNK